LDELAARLREFAAAREWEQFHTPKNLAMALAGEVGELLAELQWLTPEKAARVMVDRRRPLGCDRSWRAPLFASLEQGAVARLHPDWRPDQEKAVRGLLGSPLPARSSSVSPPPYCTATGSSGESCILAVDAAHQRHGVRGRARRERPSKGSSMAGANGRGRFRAVFCMGLEGDVRRGDVT